MLLAGIVFAYGFSLSEPTHYQINVTFSGDFQIMGMTTNTVEVGFKVKVVGTERDAEKHPQAISEIEAFDLSMNGSKLPFDVKNIQTFFPKTKATYEPYGKLLKTDVPDIKLPIRLPGLDPKRFPDITYMPIEFPKDGFELGKPWTFKKNYNGSDMTYIVTPVSSEKGTLHLQIEASQVDVIYEDDRGMPTTDKDATVEWAAKTTAKGEADFLLETGQLSKLNLEASMHRVRVKGNVAETQDLTTHLIAQKVDK